MMTLAVVLGLAGAVLILVGLVGGGFTFSGTRIPVVGNFVRLPSFFVGGFLVLVSIFLAIYPGVEVPQPDTSVPVAVASGRTMADVDVHELPSLDSPVVMTIGAGVVVEILCTAQGEAVERLADGVISSLWNGVPGGFVPDVLIDTGTDQATAATC